MKKKNLTKTEQQIVSTVRREYEFLAKLSEHKNDEFPGLFKRQILSSTVVLAKIIDQSDLLYNGTAHELWTQIYELNCKVAGIEPNGQRMADRYD